MMDPCERCKEPLDSPACRWCFYDPGIIEDMVEALGASGHKDEIEWVSLSGAKVVSLV